MFENFEWCSVDVVNMMTAAGCAFEISMATILIGLAIVIPLALVVSFVMVFLLSC